MSSAEQVLESFRCLPVAERRSVLGRLLREHVSHCGRSDLFALLWRSVFGPTAREKKEAEERTVAAFERLPSEVKERILAIDVDRISDDDCIPEAEIEQMLAGAKDQKRLNTGECRK